MTKTCTEKTIHTWHGLGRYSQRGFVYGANCTCGWECRPASQSERDAAVAAHLSASKG